MSRRPALQYQHLPVEIRLLDSTIFFSLNKYYLDFFFCWKEILFICFFREKESYFERLFTFQIKRLELRSSVNKKNPTYKKIRAQIENAPNSDPNGNESLKSQKLNVGADGGSHGGVTEHDSPGGVDDRNPF